MRKNAKRKYNEMPASKDGDQASTEAITAALTPNELEYRLLGLIVEFNSNAVHHEKSVLLALSAKPDTKTRASLLEWGIKHRSK